MTHTGWVSIFPIGFRDGNNDWHLGRFCVTNCLNRLGHHTVIGCDNENCDIRCSRTTRTHLRERFVTWRVDECDVLIAANHSIRTNVLSDSTGFTGDNAGITNVVEQGRLSVVNMAHHRDDWRTMRKG